MSNAWLRPFPGTSDAAAETQPAEDALDNDEATVERERQRLQRLLQGLDARVVIEQVLRETRHDDLVLSQEARLIRQRIDDVVMARENALQYALIEVRVPRQLKGWPAAQLPLVSTLAIRRLALKRTRHAPALFFVGEALLMLAIALCLYFLYRLHVK